MKLDMMEIVIHPKSGEHVYEMRTMRMVYVRVCVMCVRHVTNRLHALTAY